MDKFHYVVSDGAVHAIWHADRKGIRFLLKQKPQFQIVGKAGGDTQREPKQKTNGNVFKIQSSLATDLT